MAFNSGVVFVLDENTETNYIVDGKPSSTAYTEANVFLDTRNYTSRPYYKQYAIGNMGNDKKNVEIFHDTTNPKACCVENCNNQREEQRMIISAVTGQVFFIGSTELRTCVRIIAGDFAKKLFDENRKKEDGT